MGRQIIPFESARSLVGIGMRTGLFAIAFALLAPSAYSQSPSDVPPAVQRAVDEYAKKSGLVAFGKTVRSKLEDGESETIELAISPKGETRVALLGDEDVRILAVTASAAGKEIASIRNLAAPVLTIPAGSGGKITLEVGMVCDYVLCQYFVQPFVKAPAP